MMDIAGLNKNLKKILTETSTKPKDMSREPNTLLWKSVICPICQEVKCDPDCINIPFRKNNQDENSKGLRKPGAQVSNFKCG